MDYLRRFQASMNDTDEDIEAQESWGNRPWNWVPTPLQLPAATIGGIYRNLSVSKKKDPTLRKDSSFLEPENMSKYANKKRTAGPKSRPKLRRNRYNRVGGKVVFGPVVPPAMKAKYNLGGIRRKKNVRKKGPGRRLLNESKSYRTGAITRFGAGKTPGSLRMSGRQRLGEMYYSSGQGQPLLRFDALSRADTVMVFNPTMRAYFGQPLVNIATVFQKFLWLRVTFEYKAKCPTTQNGAFQFAYSPDVNYLEGQGVAGTTPSISESQVVTLPDTLSHVFFEDCKWSPNMMRDRSALSYYSLNEYSATDNGYTLDAANDAAEDRQQYQGMWIVTGSNLPTTSDGTVFGDVFISYDIELSTASSVPVTHIGTTAREGRLKRLAKDLAMLEETRRSASLERKR